MPTLEAARTAIAEYIEVYHRSAHRGQGMNEHCPLAVWNTATDLRKAENEALTLLLGGRGVYKVGANGGSLKVGNTTLTYGASEPQLIRLRSREVFITLDPDDVSYCAAWTADRDNRRYIARLQCNERVSPLSTVDDLRTATATVNRRRKADRQRDREAPARMRNAAAELRVQQRAKLAELRATGTDDHRPNVTVVQTGFEGASKPIRTVIETLPLDRRTRDLSAVAEALGFNFRAAEPVNERPRATLDALLSKSFIDDGSPEDDGDREQGKDADLPRADLFGLLSERRHERTDG